MGNQLVNDRSKPTQLPTVADFGHQVKHARQLRAAEAVRQQAVYTSERASGFVPSPCLCYVSAKMEEEFAFIARHKKGDYSDGIRIFFDSGDKRASACSSLTRGQSENLVQRLQTNGFEASFIEAEYDPYDHNHIPKSLHVQWEYPV